MASLITLIALVLLIVVIVNYDDMIGLVGTIFLVCLIVTGVIVCLVINGRTVQAKIEMYEEENQRIEEEIGVLVQNYMDYESETYGELKGESNITLVSLYPELKSDSLVERQIEVYVENNQKIRKLKEELINQSNYRWWLYFGK